MDWGDPVHRFGVVLSDLERRRELDNHWTTFTNRYSLFVQLDIQNTAEYGIVAA